jgi:hypothetical protein
VIDNHDLFYALPDIEYLDFVSRVFSTFQTESSAAARFTPVDPFAVDISDEALFSGAYVYRSTTWQQVASPACQVVLGEPGVGKSVLFVALTRELPGEQSAGEAMGAAKALAKRRVLTVDLNLERIGLPPSMPDAERGNVLTPSHLSWAIFNVYWEKTLVRRDHYFRSSDRHTKHMDELGKQMALLRRDRTWMERLRQFYRRFPPAHPEIEDEFEFMAWLHAGQQEVTSASSPLVLQQLLRLITYPPAKEGEERQRPAKRLYDGVSVLVDGTDRLSAPEIHTLLVDAQSLYDMHLDGLNWKLFLDQVWSDQVWALPAVQQGRISVVRPAPWQTRELQQLLRRRAMLLCPGAYAALDTLPPPDYALHKLLNEYLDDSLRSSLETEVIQHSHQSPLRALLLARGVVACAARCRREAVGVKPSHLVIKDLKALAKIVR